MKFQVITNKSGDKLIDFGKEQDTQSFYQLAYKLQTILSIRYHKKTDSFNTLIWNYSYHGVPFHLHHHWDSGTRILLDNTKPSVEEQDTLNDIVSVLERFL